MNVDSVEVKGGESVDSVATAERLRSRCVDESHWTDWNTTAKCLTDKINFSSDLKLNIMIDICSLHLLFSFIVFSYT